MKKLDYKETLAKLMATENVDIVHGDYKTAAFDIENRILYLPDFVNMGEDVYDLLISHEVSHALNTPVEGYHSATEDEQDQKFKGFLNIVEDARIEKMIQRKFPGLKKSYITGYKKLFDKDMFGIKEYSQEELDNMLLIDRLNVRAKLGKLAANVNIKNEEKHFEDKLNRLKTWEDVVKLAKELFEYCKEELDKKQESDDTIKSSGKSKEDSEEQEGQEGQGQQNQSGNESADSGGDDDGDDQNSQKTDAEDDEVPSDKKASNSQANTPSNSQNLPESHTDKMFRENEGKLVENSQDYSNSPYYSSEIPVVDLDGYLYTDCKTVVEEVHKIMKKGSKVDLRELNYNKRFDRPDDEE
mgnify:CR=1 FL=1|tara:strand:+ start:2240 stop:3307 length:1068 start_codon:yes stop_codon:yes gene_type:complete